MMKVYKRQAKNKAIISVFTSIILIAGFNTHNNQTKRPTLSIDDRIRIGEGFRIADQIGNEIWDGWNAVPFAVLLITPEYEFLIRHPNPSDDFNLSEYDSVLQSNIYFRRRLYQTNLLATFPAVSGISTIVIGQPENTTSNTSTRWVITLLHEHFHQLQNSQSDYYSDVDALNLAKGDKSGMWMLNYPFPYESEQVVKQFSILTQSLYSALKAIEEKQFQDKTSKYYDERIKFQQMLKVDDYKYFSFQLWQEGIARYTEYSIAKLGAEKYEPTKEFKALEEFNSFHEVAESILKDITLQISQIRIDELKRISFYYLGAAEALLLNKMNPNWKQYYFKEKFFIEKYRDMGN